MTIQYIRDYYKVPAKRGGKIKYRGGPYVIVGAKGQYLSARMLENEGLSRSKLTYTLHPTWEVEYET